MRGRMIRRLLPLTLATALAAGGVMAATASTRASIGTVDIRMTSSLGGVLAGSNGHTLYRYTVDSKGVNRCSSVPACNGYWPALLVKPGTKPTAGAGATPSLLGTIAAAHGVRQVTYAGFPLYFFSGDRSAGQTNGQGVGHTWYAVAANGTLVTHAVKAAPISSADTKKSAW